MSKPPTILPFPDPRRVEEEAADWVARFAGGEATAADRAQFEAWLRRGPSHRDALQRMAALWHGTGHSPELAELQAAVMALEPQAARRGATRRAALIAAGVGALALGLFALEAHRRAPLPAQSAAFVTEPGAQRTLALVDGSTMMMNVDTEASVAIGPAERRVRLLRGEAYFEVAPDLRRPFIVDTGANLVRATGTAFSVSVSGTRVEVVVDEGHVQVLERVPPGGTAAGARARDSFARVTPLAVGQHAVVDAGRAMVERVAPVDLERRLSWREGIIVFAGEPLSEVVSQMSRYSGVRIHIDDEELRSIPIGGRFRVGDVDGMLEALESVFGVEVRRDGAGDAHISVRR